MLKKIIIFKKTNCELIHIKLGVYDGGRDGELMSERY